MDKTQKLDLIRTSGVVAIMRAQNSDQLIDAADAIKDGGVRVIEVTMTTPRALNVIAEATQRHGESVLFGAGSVLDTETARTAILAGAGFIVTPTLSLSVIKLCNRYAIPVIPGVFTPTEALAAQEAGADLVKLFPANIGGPSLVAAIRAPLPQLSIIPVGGVDLETTAPFIRSGATAVGVGSSLVDQELLDSGNMAELTRRAAAFVEKVQEGRQS